MGAGFYLMIAAAIVMYKVAETDHRRGWLWFGITFCTIMLVSRLTGLGLSVIFVGSALVFLAMFFANVYAKSKR